MKKLFLLFLFTSSLFVTTQGQDARFGLRAGYSQSNWEGFVLAIADFEVENVTGFHLGAYVNVKFSSAISLEPGLLYSQKGVKGVESLSNTTVTNTSSYLDVPLFLRLYVKGFNVGAGPQLSMLLTNEIEVDFSGSVTSMDTDQYFESLEFGLALTLGYDFNMGLNINATFDLGLSNILVPENALPATMGNTYYTWVEAKNRVLKLSLGYTF